MKRKKKKKTFPGPLKEPQNYQPVMIIPNSTSKTMWGNHEGIGGLRGAANAGWAQVTVIKDQPVSS
jgi:hypothetical protein